MAKRKSLSAAEQARRRAQSDASAKPWAGSFPGRGRPGIMLMGLCMDPLPSEMAGVMMDDNTKPPAEAGTP